MADFKPECLPILVISARDQNSAKAIISEIIENNDLERSSDDYNVVDCVWTIVNKYYTADVRLHALLDGQELDSQLGDSVEAHLIYMAEDECVGANAIDVVRRRARSVPAAHVRVVAADAADAAALAAACAAARLELVPLREAPAADDERDECGLVRVRAAFHAHMWPGLVRRGCDESLESTREAPSDSSDDEWSAWCSGPAAAADPFAAALAALPGAAAAARRAAAAGSREERLARAEDLVAAFCRALGSPLD